METLNFTQEQVTKILSDIAVGKEGINKVLKIFLEALMRAERQEHNESTNDVSNGYRPRKVISNNTIFELRVPRSRYHHFYPVLLAVLKSQQREMEELAFKLYGSGLTTEQVGDIFKDLYGKHYSTSQISRMFDFAREEVKQWLDRPLESYYPIIYIDATYISTRRVESVSKEAYYTVLGVKADRTREVLSIINLPTESKEGWKFVFEQLRSRGIKRVDLVVSDAFLGIEDAVSSVYSGVSHQFCVFHLKRNILQQIKPKDKKEIESELEEVFETGNKEDSISNGWQRWLNFIEKNKNKYPVFSRLKADRYRYYFTYLQYDYRVRSMLYTTNWLERLHRDFKRTTKMRGALPSPEATILLLGYVAMNKKAYQRKVPKLNYEKSFDWEE